MKYSEIEALDNIKMSMNASFSYFRLKKCPKCNYTTKLKSRIKRHIKSVHEGLKRPKRFKCSIRKKKLHSKMDVQQHIVNVHGRKLKFLSLKGTKYHAL